jgi:hypothetical protein
MSLDDFSKRVLDPAMSVLAANIEYDAMSMYKDVYNEISDVGDTLTLLDVLEGSKVLNDSLTPSSNRTLNLTPRDHVSLVNSLTSTFNPVKNISDQFRDGLVADNFMGFSKVYMNTLLPTHTTGSETANTWRTDIAAGEANGSAGLLHIDTGATTFKKGDIIEIQNVFDVHPETKQSTGILKRFVVTADFPAAEGDFAISPSITATGGRQNVSAAAADGAIVYKRESDRSTAIAANADYTVSLAYHADAFTFATADLIMPKGVDWSAREVMDGISMRVVRQYDINNDRFPCRIDVLYGYKTIRPQLACRLGFN